MIKRIILFIILNFGALILSGLFTPAGITSDWYINLHKAPWTPPGWLFGFAWTFIMICLTAYMAIALKEQNQLLTKLYGIQLVLNVIWTPVFFYFRQAELGLIVIILLTAVVTAIIVLFRTKKNTNNVLLAPYFIWLCIATSLNLYIVLNNSL
jgi:benzodiazapine receptor